MRSIAAGIPRISNFGWMPRIFSWFRLRNVWLPFPDIGVVLVALPLVALPLVALPDIGVALVDSPYARRDETIN